MSSPGFSLFQPTKIRAAGIVGLLAGEIVVDWAGWQ